MKERLFSCVSYLDGDFLWCYDEIICTLNQVNLKTLQVDSIISSNQILIDGGYEVRKIVGWKDKIIVIPVEINKKWIFFDKIEKKVEYKKICTKYNRSVEAILDGDQLFLLPVSVCHPIVVVDLNTGEVSESIYLFNSDFRKKNEMEIWKAKLNKKDSCFFIQNSFFFGILKKNRIQLIKIKISELLACADFDDDFGWGVDINGKYLIKFDREGNLVKRFFLESGITFARIIVTKKYIFLLPYVKNKITVFDIVEEKKEKVEVDNKDTFQYLELLNLPSYWDSVEIDNKLLFLPINNSLLIIDLKTLICEEKTLEYSEMFSEKLYWSYYKNVRKVRRKYMFYENGLNVTTQKYIQAIKQNSLYSSDKNWICGKEVWKTLS